MKLAKGFTFHLSPFKKRIRLCYGILLVIGCTCFIVRGFDLTVVPGT